MVITLVLIGLSIEYAVTYQVYYNGYIGQRGPPRILLGGGSRCFLNNIWRECPVIPQDYPWDKISSSRTKTVRNSDIFFNNLYAQRTNAGRVRPVTKQGMPYFNRRMLINPYFNWYRNSLPVKGAFPTYLNLPSASNLFYRGGNMGGKPLNYQYTLPLRPESTIQTLDQSKVTSYPYITYSLRPTVQIHSGKPTLNDIWQTPTLETRDFNRNINSYTSHYFLTKQQFNTATILPNLRSDMNTFPAMTVYNNDGSGTTPAYIETIHKTNSVPPFKMNKFDSVEPSFSKGLENTVAEQFYTTRFIELPVKTSIETVVDEFITVTPRYQDEHTPSLYDQTIKTKSTEYNAKEELSTLASILKSTNTSNLLGYSSDLGIKVNTFSGTQKKSNSTHVISEEKEITQDNPIDKVTSKMIENTGNISLNFGEVQISTAEEKIERRKKLFAEFMDALDKIERKFFTTTFIKLTSISPVERRENGISFAQSGLFLSLTLLALSTETDAETKAEIDRCLGLNVTDAEKVEIIEDVLSTLPSSNNELQFRWASRLVLGASQNVSAGFESGAASALRLRMSKFYGTETDEIMARDLNRMVEQDSGGAIHDTFDAEEMSDGVRAVALTTLYLRGAWRAAPTVLNGTRPFRDGPGSSRASRMIRINDLMGYADFHAWNFEALEISYSTPGLSLLVLIPREASLRPVAERLRAVGLREITARMVTMRVAATMPLYTLRMTLLLPSKLQSMGINKLISDNNTTDSGKLKLSHAVQRLMFWSEAGRNAFKDDGIEWDEAPELELVVDRPYLFFVRWRNITLMNGNFVL